MGDMFDIQNLKERVRVISYTRFSSRKQSKGLSYVRQMEAAREWCAKNGYTLDESDQFADLGVSAYSGANAEAGDLARLLELLQTGKIERGTILIVEALDRITRQALPRAITLLMNLATSGLRVVTLSDGRVWDEASMHDLGSFMMSVVTLYRGHQESEYKSMRLRKTFRKHRELGSQQAFGAAPGWLYREAKDKPWQVDEEKAAVVRKVFELAAAGFGSKAISRKANEEGWPVPTRLNMTDGRWHGQMPGQLLRNRAVLGEHQHRIRTHEAHSQSWQGLLAGAPIPDYYPRIVSEELWNRARASIRTRMMAKRRDAHYYNIFSGIMYCGHCGAPIHRKNEKNGYSRAQLNCSDKQAGATRCRTMAGKACDPQILTAIYEYAVQQLGVDRNSTYSEDIAVLQASIAEKLEECERIADAVAKTKGRVQAFIDKSVALADEVEELQEQLAELRESESEVAPGSVFDDSFVADALKYLYVSDDDTAKEKRAELHLKLARVVDCIWVWAYDCAVIRYKDSPALHPVMLDDKRLPSRANPNAKWHKPPKPREPAPKPVYMQALMGELVPPEPRRALSLEKKLKPLLLEYEDDEEDDYEMLGPDA